MTTYNYWEAYHHNHASSNDPIECSQFAFNATLDSINHQASEFHREQTPDWKKTPLEILEDSLNETRQFLEDANFFSDLEILNMTK